MNVSPLVLTDDKGNTYALKASSTSLRYAPGGTPGATCLYKPYTLRLFEPNTVYTLSGAFSTPDDPSQLEFRTQFTTSSSQLYITDKSPAPWAYSVSVNAAVELRFNAPVQRGSAHANITFKDSKGNSVAFRAEEIENGERLIPLSKLSSLTTYTASIPEGAYVSGENIARAFGYKIESFEWRIDGEVPGT